MNEDQVVSQMRTTISAGYETVSAILAVSTILSRPSRSRAYHTSNNQWVLYEVARHPVLQAELREEVSIAQDSSLDVLNKFPLLDAVIQETLRLHPAILENHHEVSLFHIQDPQKYLYTSPFLGR